jgi:ADP-ribose pyrophosphatase YjhB (NUDIX family)
VWTAGVTRPCAFVFIREGDRVLVARMTDPTDGSPFYRPLGGGIEFQERAADAARREIREELGAELGELRLLGVVENVFEHVGKQGHEICFVYDAEPNGWSLDRFDGHVVPDAAAAGGDETACVVGVDELQTLTPLYPDGVRDLLG